jgi:hypothetical protein
MDCHATLPRGSCNGGDNITPGRAALRDFNPAYDRLGSSTDQSATSVQGVLMFTEQTSERRNFFQVGMLQSVGALGQRRVRNRVPGSHKTFPSPPCVTRPPGSFSSPAGTHVRGRIGRRQAEKSCDHVVFCLR